MYNYKNDSICYKISACFAILRGYINLTTWSSNETRLHTKYVSVLNDDKISLKENEIVININHCKQSYFVREEEEFEVL
uniref:Uncharacterized protein n=1 Tax=viral metagenome TaxID=1070528 RepID=A0A6C0KCE4_9ZZZZ